jgi:hypothetical protein
MTPVTAQLEKPSYYIEEFRRRYLETPYEF